MLCSEDHRSDASQSGFLHFPLSSNVHHQNKHLAMNFLQSICRLKDDPSFCHQQLKCNRYRLKNKKYAFIFVFHDLIRYELAAMERGSKKGTANHGSQMQMSRWPQATGLHSRKLVTVLVAVGVVQARARCQSSIRGGQKIHP